MSAKTPDGMWEKTSATRARWAAARGGCKSPAQRPASRSRRPCAGNRRPRSSQRQARKHKPSAADRAPTGSRAWLGVPERKVWSAADHAPASPPRASRTPRCPSPSSGLRFAVHLLLFAVVGGCSVAYLVRRRLTLLIAHHVGVDDVAALPELVLQVLPRRPPGKVADEATLADPDHAIAALGHFRATPTRRTANTPSGGASATELGSLVRGPASAAPGFLPPTRLDTAARRAAPLPLGRAPELGRRRAQPQGAGRRVSASPRPENCSHTFF